MFHARASRVTPEHGERRHTRRRRTEQPRKEQRARVLTRLEVVNLAEVDSHVTAGHGRLCDSRGKVSAKPCKTSQTPAFREVFWLQDRAGGEVTEGELLHSAAAAVSKRLQRVTGRGGEIGRAHV